MFKFLFPLGARLSIVIDSIEYFFNTLHEKKENKINKNSQKENRKKKLI